MDVTEWLLQAYQEVLRQGQLQAQQLRQQEDVTENERRQLQTQLDGTRDQRRDLERQLEEVVGQQRTNEQELGAAREDERRLEQERAAREEHRQRVEAELQREVQLEQQAQAEAQALENQMRQVQDQISRYEELAASERARGDTHCADVYMRYANSHRANLYALQSRLWQARARANGRSNQLRHQLSMAQQQAQQAANRLREQNARRQRLEQRAAQLQQQRTKVTDDVSATRARETQLAGDTASREARIVALNSERHEVEQDIARNQETLRGLNAERRQAESELGNAQGQLATARTQLQTAENGHRQKVGQLQQLRQQVQQKQDEISKVESQVAVEEQKRDLTARQAENASKAAADMEGQVQTMSACLRGKRERYEQARADLQQKEGVKLALASEFDEQISEEARVAYQVNMRVNQAESRIHDLHPRASIIPQQQLRDAAKSVAQRRSQDQHRDQQRRQDQGAYL